MNERQNWSYIFKNTGEKYKNKNKKYKNRTIYVKKYRNSETPVIAKTRKTYHYHNISAS